jgi:hypothetical protein
LRLCLSPAVNVEIPKTVRRRESNTGDARFGNSFSRKIPDAILALSILTGARWLPEGYKVPSHALTAGKSKLKRASPTGEPDAVLAGRIPHFANS